MISEYTKDKKKEGILLKVARNRNHIDEISFVENYLIMSKKI